GAGVAGGDVLVFTGYGNGTITRIGATDTYLITADAAHGSGSETIRLAGVTNLTERDYEFVSASGEANLSPTDIVASNLAVKRTAASGTVIGELTAIDRDAGDTSTFLLIDDADGRFLLSGNSLVLAGPLDLQPS